MRKHSRNITVRRIPLVRSFFLNKRRNKGISVLSFETYSLEWENVNFI